MSLTTVTNFQSPSTETKCPHCSAMSETGTHGGCGRCGKVKFTESGRVPVFPAKKEQ